MVQGRGEGVRVVEGEHALCTHGCQLIRHHGPLHPLEVRLIRKATGEMQVISMCNERYRKPVMVCLVLSLGPPPALPNMAGAELSAPSGSILQINTRLGKKEAVPSPAPCCCSEGAELHSILQHCHSDRRKGQNPKRPDRAAVLSKLPRLKSPFEADRGLCDYDAYPISRPLCCHIGKWKAATIYAVLCRTRKLFRGEQHAHARCIQIASVSTIEQVS